MLPKPGGGGQAQVRNGMFIQTTFEGPGVAAGEDVLTDYIFWPPKMTWT